MNNLELLKYWSYCELVNSKNYHKLDYVNKLKTKYDEGGIFYTPNEIVIVIDGSSDTNEWISNFDFKVNEYGFHGGLYDVAFEFYLLLKDYAFDRKVTFVGHSRGGLVLILAHLLRLDNCEVITFCSPKVTSIRGYLRLKRSGIKHTRVYITRDVVDNLPPMIMGFIHYDTSKVKLKCVVGKLNHLAIRDSLLQ